MRINLNSAVSSQHIPNRIGFLKIAAAITVAIFMTACGGPSANEILCAQNSIDLKMNEEALAKLPCTFCDKTNEQWIEWQPLSIREDDLHDRYYAMECYKYD